MRNKISGTKISDMNKKELKDSKLKEDLTMLLMWLTRFKEGRDISRKDAKWNAWKGYDFEVLNSLFKKGLISFSYKSKRVFISDKGKKKAKELLDKFISK